MAPAHSANLSTMMASPAALMPTRKAQLAPAPGLRPQNKAQRMATPTSSRQGRVRPVQASSGAMTLRAYRQIPLRNPRASAAGDQADRHRPTALKAENSQRQYAPPKKLDLSMISAALIKGRASPARVSAGRGTGGKRTRDVAESMEDLYRRFRGPDTGTRERRPLLHRGRCLLGL